MYWLLCVKLINIVDLICLIIWDEVVYGYYIGYKFQCVVEKLDEVCCVELKDFVFVLMFDLYDIEQKYIVEFYDGIGLIEDVKVFLYYNVNKVL